MPRKVHDGPAMGTAQRPAPEQPPEWQPRPLPESWWQTCQEQDALVERLLTIFTDPAAGRGRDQTRRRGLAKLLDWLQSQPGETWQDRWLASGADAAGSGWAGLPLGDEPSPRHRRDELPSHTGSPAAFVSPDHGPLGHVVEGRVRIPVRIQRWSPALSFVPRRSARVGLATISFGEDGTLIEAMAEQVDGLVVAAFGVGHVPAAVAPVLGKLAERIPVVLASRTGAGPVHLVTYGFPGSERDLLARGLISAGYLNPLKARILLHLLIASGADDVGIRETFAAADDVSELDVCDDSDRAEA